MNLKLASLSLSLVLVACDGNPDQRANSAEASKEVIEYDEIPSLFLENFADLAALPAEHLLPLQHGAFPNGSHKIYELNEDGTVQSAILFRWSDSGRELDLEDGRLVVFREVVKGNQLERRLLSEDRCVADLAQIEQKLRRYLGAKVYAYFEGGGLPEEKDASGPVDEANPVVTGGDVDKEYWREVAEFINHKSAASIVHLILRYRDQENGAD